MPNKNFYNYSIQTFEGAKQALADLLQKREAILKKDPSMKHFFGYVEDLNNLANDEKNELFATHKNLLKFLDKDLVSSYIKLPFDKDLKRDLVRQILSIYLGTGGALDAEIYLPADFKQIAEGLKVDVEESILVRTLGKILVKELEVEPYVHSLIYLLSTEGGAEAKGTADWRSFFLLALTLQVMWHNFSHLNYGEQEVFLKNYLFLSIVSGIPVTYYLDYYLKSTVTDEELRKDLLVTALTESLESVPLNISFTEWQTLPMLIKTVESRGGRNGVLESFLVEQYLDESFANQNGRDTLKSWLRELFKIMFLV